MARKRPKPLAKQPPAMRSRKKARRVTTEFHKLTHERDKALREGNTSRVGELDEALAAMGGRPEYQRASQLSTSFHSTSRWVLGSLAQRNGWLYGVPLVGDGDISGDHTGPRSRRRRRRRPTRILEVGAINTELLDAAAETKPAEHDDDDNTNETTKTKYLLDVRAIDLHAMDDRIEEADFLALPPPSGDHGGHYDVIVCSMVLNCVPTPLDRGRMLARLYHHLRPGGLLFLTLPKYCLTRSAFLTLELFTELLGKGTDARKRGVGFEVLDTKQSPKVAFFIAKRPELGADDDDEEGTGTPPPKRPPPRLDPRWKKSIVRNKGKKFPNQFSVVLEEDEVFGRVRWW